MDKDEFVILDVDVPETGLLSYLPQRTQRKCIAENYKEIYLPLVDSFNDVPLLYDQF